MSEAPSFNPDALSRAKPGPPPTEAQRALAERIRARAASIESARELLDAIVAAAHEAFPSHAWTGVYLVDGDDLLLGPFRGPDTPHKRIRIGAEGICGWVARHGRPQIIPDVNADPRYLSCSPVIRSEIVLPIEHRGRILGVLDVDSETRDVFTQTDLEILAELAEIVAPVLACEEEKGTRP